MSPLPFAARWKAKLLRRTGLGALMLLASLLTCFASARLPLSEANADRDLATQTQARIAWRLDWQTRCLAPHTPPDTVNPFELDLAVLLRFVAQEPTVAAPLLMRAQANGIEVCLVQSDMGARGAFDRNTNLVWLDTRVPFAHQTIILIHELRHVDVIADGVVPNPSMALRDAVRLHLAMEADAHMVGVLYAWQASRAGDPWMWDAALTLTQHDDVARALSAALITLGPSPSAYREAFLAWYEDEERVADYRLYACMMFLDCVDEQHLPPGYADVHPDVYRRLGLLPSGEWYDATPALGD